MTAFMPRRALLGAAALLPLARPALAQAFPSRPIRFICPFPAGGIVDLVMRTHTDELAAELGQPVVIDVRTGAGGLIGSQQLVQAAPDGHTWLMASLGNIVAPILTPSGFHPVEAIQGLSLVSHSVSVVVVRGDSTARTIQDVAALAKARPGQLNYLRAGNGSFAHMSMELMQRVMGFQVTAVDYRGLPPGILDMLAGRLDLAVLSTGLAKQHIQSGTMRAVAAIGSTRSPDLPDVPTLTEAGVPEANMDSWYIAVAPRGLPDAALARIHGAYTKVLSTPAVQQKLRSVGTIPAATLPPAAEVQAMLVREHAKFERLVREANIRAS
ncbi:tripartite tricarboxylate transporter substrate binding protein [Roseomonas sp. HF4]|uniref:Bug family tripartite tricarboxylate transporter substrate binding protein n=1 Tax=Roseomonas sp. HF4 TaxID=2562313 RepID=UPI0010BF6D0D|nr:tripartite tricarboxylate transporter substrate binding protein [Roseomonas sp. HF4]